MSQLSPSEIWNEFHIKQNRSGEASKLALKELELIDIKQFTDESQADSHGEYARIAEVTGVSAAKKSAEWLEAREHVLRSLQVVLENYPLADTADEATLRGNYWEKVYGDESAQLICLRDIFHLVSMLSEVFSIADLSDFVAGIKELLKNLSDDMGGERFALIFMIEEFEYEKAKVAYNNFNNNFGYLESNSGFEPDPNQVITVVSRFLGRAVAEKDYPQCLECLKMLMVVLQNEPSLTNFAVMELIRNLSKFLKERFLARRYQSWSKETVQDKEVADKINLLVRNTFVGLGNDVVRNIK